MDNLPASDRQENLAAAKRRVIACATVIEEMLPFLPEDVPYEVLDFGLHLRPADLKFVLQTKINEASRNADILLLGYGLCSMAVIGLQATTATLVIPRVDDCIGIFLGSCQAYKEQAKQEPGTYYLTKGWIEVGDNIFEEHKRMAESIGEENAQPSVTTPEFNDTTYYSNTNIQVSTTYTHPDETAATVYFKWYRNGTNIHNKTNASIASGTVYYPVD